MFTRNKTQAQSWNPWLYEELVSMFCLRRAIADIFYFWFDMILCIYIYFICMASSKCFLFITNLIYIMAKKPPFDWKQLSSHGLIKL